MKKTTNKIMLPLIGLVTLSGCGQSVAGDIITTNYFSYDIAKQIVGDKLSVSQLVPFGSEIHDFEPTPKDIIQIKNADLFLYTSNESDPWVANTLDGQNNGLNISSSYVHKDFFNTNTQEDKLHYWTDPTTFLSIIDTVSTSIINIDPDNTDFYLTNTLSYRTKIETLHNEVATYFNNKTNKEIFFYGHNAMSNFANRYGLQITSLDAKFNPDGELSPGQLINLKNQIKENNAKYLFVEELIDLSAPRALLSELASEGFTLEILELHSYHNITSKQNDEGVTYYELFKNNFTNLKTALD